jgi:hypothetical protein
VLALISTALLVAVALMVPATLLVLTVPARPLRPSLATTLTSASVAGVLVGTAALALGGVLGAGAPRSLAVAVLLGASLVAWAPAIDAWDLRGLTTWALGVDVVVAFLAYVAAWILYAGLGLWGMLAGAVLVLAEAFVLLIGLGHLWDFVDVLSHQHRHRGQKHGGWARPVRRGALVLATAVLAVGGFVAFASPVGGPDLVGLPRAPVPPTQPTQPTQPTVLGGGRPLVPLSSSSRSVGGIPTAVRLGTTALPTSSSSAVGSPTSAGSSTTGPGSASTDPSSPTTIVPSTPPSTTSQPTRAPSSSPTTGSTTPGPSSDPTSSPPTSDPTSGPTHTHPTHPSHSSKPTDSTGPPTPSGPACGSDC